MIREKKSIYIPWQMYGARCKIHRRYQYCGGAAEKFTEEWRELEQISDFSVHSVHLYVVHPCLGNQL